MAHGQDRRKIESILSEPLTRHRFLLNGKLRAAQDAEKPQPFTLTDLSDFCNAIQANDPDFKKEVLNMLEAVQVGKAPQRPTFDTPEKQLVWGAALAYLKLNPDAINAWSKKPPVAEADKAKQPAPLVSETELWQQLRDTRKANEELLSHAHHVREALRDKDTKYDWGEPGSSFTYDRNKNVIGIDMMQTLIVGFEHARAEVYREIGHALLSVSYTKRMIEVFKEMQPLLRRSREAAAKKGPKLKPDEYKQLRMLSAEWQLRHMMFNAAEENVANKFVSNMGQQVLQDYSVSLNNTAVTHRAIGLTRLPPPKNASEELRRYMNLCNAVQLSFFQNNSLFDNTDDGWFRVGVDPNMVRKTATLAKRPDGAKDDQDGINHADFKYLRELCGGPSGLENLQPKQHERLYGWNNLMGRVSHADQARKAIIEEIWKLYGEDLIQKILKQANDQVDQQLKEAKEKQDQKGEDGEEQDGEDQDGEEQDGEGQPGEGKPGKGKGKGKGQKGKRGQQQGEPGEPGEDGEPQEGDEGEPQDGKPEGDLGKGDGQVPVEDAGDMDGVEDPNEVPSDEVDPSAGEDANGQDGEGQDGDAKSMEDLEKEAEKNEGEGQEGEGQEGEGDEPGEGEGEGEGEGQKPGKGKGKGKGKPGQGKGAGHGDGKPLSELAKQDWKNYPERIAELSGPINRVRMIFKEIQKKQLQRKTAFSRTLDILPENGEVKERFNTEAHRSLTIKKLTGTVEIDDLKRFHVDQNKYIPAELDIVIMIDGSGSMGSAMGNGPSPLQSALQASAILYEAAAGKDMHMNVYVGMWGDSNPPVLIKPGDDRVSVGKAMEKMRQGLNSGTDFAPAVLTVAKTIGEQRGKSGTLSGFTHVLVISDGDMFDVEKSKERINTMFDYSDKVTFDVAIITAQSGSGMEKMAKSMKARKPSQEFGVVLGKDPNEVPMAIVGLLLDKVRKCGSFVAVPNSQKRRAMKKAHNKMGPKR